MSETFLIECLGTLAGLLSTLSFLPQAIKVWRTQSSRDLSLGMYVLYTFALLFWGIYGWLIQSWPLLITEVLTFLLSLYILIMKLTEK